MCVFFNQKMYLCGVKPCKKHQNYDRQIAEIEISYKNPSDLLQRPRVTTSKDNRMIMFIHRIMMRIIAVNW